MPSPKPARALIAIVIDSQGNADPPAAYIAKGWSVEFTNLCPDRDCELTFDPPDVFGPRARIAKDSGIWAQEAERQDVVVHYWTRMKDEQGEDVERGPYTITVGASKDQTRSAAGGRK